MGRKLKFSKEVKIEAFKMFDKAIEKYLDAKPIFHRDCGFQYTSNVFKKKIEVVEMKQSMSRKALNYL
ncbi:hypothetical protein [Tepidibacter formicigenes]|jgi:hypothetical protein|uniref:Integrase core domain-containing protein n=1 Tax=Tepidibacter formicigenes DSM 15518 TaxID=1123349 RepID=A0A1M6NJI2_9FIRM|nr:hypothetical protein [Tepidibacter formicigenes]SHJ95840.1 hypothetical protein SAMN02744037_01283 [Tepidibacter formicigenes DSM 15518]